MQKTNYEILCYQKNSVEEVKAMLKRFNFNDIKDVTSDFDLEEGEALLHASKSIVEELPVRQMRIFCEEHKVKLRVYSSLGGVEESLKVQPNYQRYMWTNFESYAMSEDGKVLDDCSGEIYDSLEDLNNELGLNIEYSDFDENWNLKRGGFDRPYTFKRKEGKHSKAKSKLLALGPEWYLETVICEYDAFSIHKLKDGTLIYYDHDEVAADFIRERGEITDECYLSVRDDQFLEVVEVERFDPEVYKNMDDEETEALCKKPFDVKGELDDFSALVFWKEV